MDISTTTPLHHTAKDKAFENELAPYLGAFIDQLKQGRYANGTIRTYIAGIGHFARWASQSHLSPKILDESIVSQFLDGHLPFCDCPAPSSRSYHDLRAACGHLLSILRTSGVIARPVAPASPVGDELACFDGYMRDAQGLAAKTRSGRIGIVQRFLLARFADRQITLRQITLSALQPADVRQFIAGQLEQCGTTSNASALATALRAYFRYRTVCGDRVQALMDAIARPAHWDLASLPRSLSPDEIDRLLASFTVGLPSPRRGYAMVRCALDLGLRVGEVAKLKIADIDWQNGTVTLRRTKSRREDILPLPAAGQAIADYLLFERPSTTNPAVFVRDAYRRIGLKHTRAHALRHTLACQLLDHGSSLKEVADVLRHRSLNTTLIYAKLDNRRLLAVALPWPGSVS